MRYYLRKYQNKAGQKFYHTLFYTPTTPRKIICKLDIVYTISKKNVPGTPPFQVLDLYLVLLLRPEPSFRHVAWRMQDVAVKQLYQTPET